MESHVLHFIINLNTARMNLHYGCGLDAPEGWQNYDISPTLRIQKLPLIGGLIVDKFYNIKFPDSVKYGDVLRGFRGVKRGSCSAVYCSHTLEHLSLADCRKAISNTYDLLEVGGVFRCVVPDLEVATKQYLNDLKAESPDASIEYLTGTYLGKKSRPRGIKALVSFILGNADHLWMWDHVSLANELKKAGFSKVRKASYNDSDLEQFKAVENPDRFIDAVALEAIK